MQERTVCSECCELSHAAPSIIHTTVNAQHILRKILQEIETRGCAIGVRLLYSPGANSHRFFKALAAPGPYHMFISILPHRLRGKRARGFTLLELMMVGVVAGVLLAIAVPSYQKILARQKVVACVADLARIALELEKYRTAHGDFPDSLSELTGIPQRDPWGNAYRYLNFSSDIPGIKGKIRKDHNLHPLNSEFDLYSVGADGASSPPLTAKASQDDVIWARDGSFIGLASDY